MADSSVSSDRLPVMGAATAGVLAGLLGGALLVSWVAPLWIRLVGAATILALVAVPRRGRLVTASAFLLTFGGMGLATLALFAERPDGATALAATIAVALGIGSTVVGVRRNGTGGGR